MTTPFEPLNPDLLALLASCRSAPADDTPRLVLADWLDEFAEVSGLPTDDARARAELIRVQVELARPTRDDEHTAALGYAEQALLAANAARWVGAAALRLNELRQRTFGFVPTSSTFPMPAPWRFERGLLTFDLKSDELTDPDLGAWFASPLAVWTEEARVDLSGPDALERLEVADGLRPYLGVRYSVGRRPSGPCGSAHRRMRALARSD